MTGFMIRHTTGEITAKARDTQIGLTTIMALKEELPPPKFEMTCTMTRPTTSSMAALARTTPSLDLMRPLVPKTVKVVPRLVEQSAAPAASGGTPTERRKLDLNVLREVDRPPITVG